MNLVWVLLVVLIIAAIVGAPGIGVWHHGFGYAPSGIFGLLIIVLIVLLLTGRL